ncbi:MAG: hypothetical protein AAGJ85_05665 [Pseudomonadota bacterium]
MLFSLIAIFTVVIAWTIAQPHRPGQIVPLFVWFILFAINMTLLGATASLWFISPEMQRVWDIPIVVIGFPLLGFVLSIVLGFVLLQSRKVKSQTDPFYQKLDARRARVEKAKREGRL